MCGVMRKARAGGVQAYVPEIDLFMRDKVFAVKRDLTQQRFDRMRKENLYRFFTRTKRKIFFVCGYAEM